MFIKLFTIFFLSLLSQSLKSSSQTPNFTYNGFHRPPANISLQGITTVASNGILKLTDTTREQTGHAFYTVPIRFKDSPNDTVFSFSTTFVFAINPHTPKSSPHGIAFVVIPSLGDPFACPAPNVGLFPSKGNETNHVLAVEFDAFPSTESNDEVGIDINNLKPKKSSSAGYWDDRNMFMNLYLVSGKPMQVWIDYDGRTHQIDVTMAPFKAKKPRKILVSTIRDLAPVFSETMFVGFSSATNLVLSEHYVLGWSFAVNGEAPQLDLSKLPKLHEHDLHSFYKKWMPLISSFVLFFFIFIVSFIVRRRRKRKFAEEDFEDWEIEFGKDRFKYEDLYRATKGFRKKGLLGSGGFGSVYRGVMPMTKKEIAVKRISNESRQGLKEFVSEIVSIGRMSHRNLVPLLGYCRRRDELLLVYDYMPNGSLDKYLYNSPEVTLSWKQRINVIKGVASALFFLHEEWEQLVIHRDVKSSNVLLDAELNGRLGDFGLARLCGHGSDPQTTDVAGTWGYLAPDHIRTRRATTATDVFSFGVLLLEVVCSKRPTEILNKRGEGVLLVDWVLEFWLEGNIMDAKDPNLGSEHDQREVEMVLKLGLLCSHPEPHARPTMRQVLHYLRGDAMLPDLSSLDLRGSGMIMGIPQGLGELEIFSGGSPIADSILSEGR